MDFFLKPPSEQPRVFISYARKDGAALAQRITGGAVWTDEIEVALDRAEYVVALLTQGSYVSEICRA
jgi:hypothetical protein